MEKIPFLGESYSSRSVVAQNQRTVNMYFEPSPNRDGSGTLYPFPGLQYINVLGGGPHRGSIEHAGNMYVVSGNTVYKVTTGEVATSIGTLNTSAQRVGMASNGTNLVIVDGTDGWVWDGATLAQITDADFVEAQQIKFLDGYFIVNKPSTGEFFISDLYPSTANLINGSGWTALDFATAEVDPDNLITHEVRGRELLLFGDYTTEFYYNSGNATFPFDRVAGGFIEWGIAAQWSVAKIDNTVIWLSKNKSGQGQIVGASSFTPNIISDNALENAIAGYPRIDDATAYSFQYLGHAFYVITFPSAPATWAYHVNSGHWIELKGYGVDRHVGETHCFFNGKHYIGDYNSGNLYSLDSQTYTNNGDIIERIRQTQHNSKSGNMLFWSRLQIDVESGVGLTSGQGSDPQIMIQWSKDQGKTWSNAVWRSMGQIGEYTWRVIVNKLGAARNMQFRVTVTDPVKFVIKDAYAFVEPGNI